MKKNIILYSINFALNKGAVFLSPFILIQYLSISDFGLWSIVLTLSSLLIPFISLNGTASILIEGSKNRKRGFLLLVRYSTLTLLITFIMAITIGYISKNWIYIYTLLLALTDSLFLLLSTYLRVRNLIFYYTLFNILKVSIFLSVATYGLFYNISLLDLLFYLFMGNLILDVVIFLFFFRGKFNYLRIKLPMNYFIKTMLFSISLIPHSISQWIINSSDKIIIAKLLGTSQVGIYSLAYNIGMILMILNSGISLAVPQIMFKNYDKWKENRYDEKLLKFYTFLTIVLYGFIIIILFIDYKYINIIRYYSKDFIIVVSLIYLSFYFLGIYYIFSNYIFFFKRGNMISSITIFVAIINIILTTLLTIYTGLVGAAMATLMSYMIYMTLTRHFAYKLEENIPIKLLLITTYIVGTSIFVFFATYLYIKVVGL